MSDLERMVLQSEDGEPLTVIVVPDQPPVPSGELAANLEERGITPRQHRCLDYPVPYVSDGPLGHGYECGVCGAFLQAG